MHLDSCALIIFLACLLVVAVCRAIRRARQLPLPPGPHGLPIIGNVALHIPKDQPWLKLAELAAQYGNVLHLSFFGTHTVVLNSHESLHDLLDDRSEIYSDRPTMTMLGSMVGWENTVVFSPLGEVHKEGRKMVFSAFSSRKMAAIQERQRTKAMSLLAKLGASPDQLRAHIRWFVASVAFEVSHGYDVKDENDPLIHLAEQCNTHFSECAVPGAFLVDVCPILRYVPSWFPGSGFKVKANEWRKITDKACDEAWNFVIGQLSSGVAKPSFTADIIQENPILNPAETEWYKKMTYNFYIAGADTTVSAIESFFLAMLLYPDVQRRAQAEIGAIVGDGEMPTYADRSKLHYLEAVMKEIFRWNPVTPLGVPHRLIKDDVYQGYRIPAGTTVIANTWAALHDPFIYPDPLEFVPDRYLSSSENTDCRLNPDPRTFLFGHGRRTCPGQSLAEDSLFIAMAATLTAYQITKAVDALGKPIEPDARYTGVLSHAVSFACHFSPRSLEIERLIAAD